MPSSSFFDYKEDRGSSSWPSISDSYTKDWSSAFSRPEPEKKKTDWGGIFSTLFDKARDTDKYRSYGEQSRPYFGDWSRGGGSQVLENLGVVYPQQQGPVVLPGMQTQSGRSGLGSAIGTLAGIGASFIPGLGPGIAAAMPAIGANVGSFFG